MIDPESMAQLRKQLRARMVEDRRFLEELRAEVRSGLGDARRIMARPATAVSFVGTDGGNNRIEFDPFMAQLIRFVDSSNNEYCLDVITLTTEPAAARVGIGYAPRSANPPARVDEALTKHVYQLRVASCSPPNRIQSSSRSAIWDMLAARCDAFMVHRPRPSR
ncbi:hypothetical protein WMF26_07950 [Sorangium sp. So ce185]|uniref:hypothetical protein n=1 Tax=Sorangium sp. So ce185 TaxID=3133287 RepID=UPI003F5ED117